MNHFGLEILLVYGILGHFEITTKFYVLNCFKYFLICFGTNVPKNQTRKIFKSCPSYLIFTKISSGKMFQQYQNVYINSITQQKLVLFLCSHLLAFENPTIAQDVTLLVLVFHVSFFKGFVFFKFNMLDKKGVLIRLKIKAICLTRKLFLNSY